MVQKKKFDFKKPTAWCLFLNHFLSYAVWQVREAAVFWLPCITVLQWQSMLGMKCLCERRPDFVRCYLVYVRMQIVNVWVFWGQCFLCDKHFGVSSCLYSYESLAAGALDAVRRRDNVSTLQLGRKYRQNDGDRNF